jgi:molybdopterin synthase catalytic subunit
MSRISVALTKEPIPIETCLENPEGGSHGAQVVFTGMVRALNLGKQVTGVSYDAFEPLAEKVLREIAEEAREKWDPAMNILIRHRTGRLGVGETSVLIVVQTPHRAEAYEASRYIIDELKVRAPIWKQEHYLEGDSQWLRGHALCQHSAP